MKKRMEHLLAGRFHYKVPKLYFSREKVTVSLKAGETAKGEVYFGTSDDRKIRGYVTSSDRRLVPGIDTFSGSTIRLPFGVDAKGMNPGEVRKDWICLTSNIGEARLSVEIRTEPEEILTNAGEIKNLEDFRDYASEDFTGAFRLFRSPAFEGILKNAPDHVAALYAGLSVPPVTYQHLEEFLTAAGLKKKVVVTLAESEKEISRVTESVEDTLTISRNTWGHVRLEVVTEGDFLYVEKRIITDEDFIGSVYRLNYIINKERLGRGRRFGRIRIVSPYETLEYRITASADADTRENPGIVEKQYRLRLQKSTLSYLSGEISRAEWTAESRSILANVRAAGFEYPFYHLYEVYLFLQGNRKEEARAVLKSLDKKSAARDPEFYGVYLWLCWEAEQSSDRAAVADEIRSLYKQKETSFLLLHAFLQLGRLDAATSSGKIFLMEELFERGCRSPFLYLEAWDLVSTKETLFRRLSPFWIQVFLFAAKRHLLSEELTMRITYLSGYERVFNPCLYETLCLGYEAYPAADSVEAICRYIMLGNPRRKEYFVWYKRAVAQDSHLTRLYEYFMETVDLSYHESFPKPLLLYFTYNNNGLGDARKAFLYSGVIDYRDTDPKIYESYRGIMDDFAHRKLLEGKISEDYAALYQEFIKRPETPEEGRALSSVAFASRVYCDNPGMRSVVVRHRALAREEIYPFSHGVAYPRIYTDDAAVLLQDESQRRYGSTVSYNRKNLMDPEQLVGAIMESGGYDAGLLLNYCETHAIGCTNLSWFEELARSEEFTPEYRRSIRQKILGYYAENVRGDDLDEYLKKLDYHEYALVDRKLLLEILMSRGLLKEAYQIVEEFGCEDMDKHSLLRLTSGRIVRTDYEADDELIALASETYRRRIYNEVILRYLMMHRYGPADELLSLRESAKGFDIDTYDFDEKLLQILMFTQDYRKEGEKILLDYMKRQGKERICGAYLTQLSYGSVVKEYAMSSEVRECLEKAWKDKWPVNRICRIALLKEISREKDKNGRYTGMKRELLKECMKDDLVFSFYRKLPPDLLGEYQLDDKTFVECHADPEAKVTLAYSFENGLGAEEGYQFKPVKNMYEGIFVKTFTLFYGESLRYYFEIEENGTVRRTQPRVLTMSRSQGAPGSKYQMINQILAARKLGRKTEAADALKQYLRREQFVEDVFVLDREEKT